MSSGADTGLPRLAGPGPLYCAAFGIWAAAIALAPTWPWKAALAAPAALVPMLWWTLARPSRWVALFLGAALLLPPLPIPIGDSGPHPAILFAALGLFAGLFRLREWRWAGAGPVLPMIALFGVLLASVAAAAVYSGETAAAGSLARVLLLGFSVYLYADLTCGTGREVAGLRPLFWVALIAALFACVDFYFQFPAPAGYGPQFVWLDSGVFRRAQGLFYEASTLGNFCAFFLVMIAVAFSRPRAESPVSRKALAAGAVVLMAGLVLSYSRASLITVAIALAVLAWQNRRRMRMLRVGALASAGALAVWMVFPVFVEAWWLRISASAEYFFTATEGVLSGRVASWRTLAAWIEANPWQILFGIGYKTLPYTSYLGAPVVADNMYLSLLVETGIAGLAALLWLNLSILHASARAARSADTRRAFCGTWMLCFWAGEIVQMTSGDLLTYWRVLPVYFFVFALAVRK
jgi:O-antigen ligase